MKIFIQSTSLPNFNMIAPFFNSLGLHKTLGPKGSHGSKNEDFEKLQQTNTKTDENEMHAFPTILSQYTFM